MIQPAPGLKLLRTSTLNSLPDKYLKSRYKPFYSGTIFSFGGNFSKLPTMLGAWVRTGCNNTLFWTDVRSKTKYYSTLITSAAKITRHLADAVNYLLRFSQSRTRIKFEYIIIQVFNRILFLRVFITRDLNPFFCSKKL